MQTPHPMTREELLELSEVDTLGLLDEYEAALFTRSFHHAPIPVQDEIRSLQEAQALNPLLLSTDEPDDSLRAKVLARLAQAIEEENSELAPLATIGRGRFEPERQESPFVLTRSWQFWRAACFVLGASLLATLFFYADAVRHSREVARLALQRTTEDDLRAELGPTLAEFMSNPACEQIVLRPTDDRVTGSAMLCVNRKSGDVFLVGLKLPDDLGELTLSAKDVAGALQPVARFAVKSAMTGYGVKDLPQAILASTAWVLTDATGAVLMQSA